MEVQFSLQRSVVESRVGYGRSRGAHRCLDKQIYGIMELNHGSTDKNAVTKKMLEKSKRADQV